MAVKEVIRDYVISIGLDSKKADKAIKELEGKIKGLAGTSAGGRGRDPKRAAGNELALTKKKFRMEQQLARLQTRLDFGLKSQARPFSPETIGKLNKSLAGMKSRLGDISNINSFGILEGELLAYKTSVHRAERQQTAFNRSLKKTGFIAGGLVGSVKNLARSWASVFAIMAGATAVNRTLQEFESLNAVMLNASDGIEEAKDNMAFAIDTANRLGISLPTAAKGFAQIGTAAKAAGFTLDQSKEIFTGVNELATAYGLSADDTSGIMRAFVQIMSKGNVQAEELRGQLGDRLPGAFVHAADAMGVTTNELDKMLKAGQLNSKEFVTKFIPHMRKLIAENGSLAAGLDTSQRAQQRFFNAFSDAVRQTGEEGLGAGLVDLWDGLAAVVRGLTPAFIAIGRILGFIVGLIGKALKLLEPFLFLASSVFDILTIPFGGSAAATGFRNRTGGFAKENTVSKGGRSRGPRNSVRNNITVNAPGGTARDIKSHIDDVALPFLLENSLKAES